MNVDEAEALLKTVRIIDPRIAVGGLIDPLQVALWAEMLADVPYRAAEAAMKEHYKTSTETIMPGHIRPLMKKIMGTWKEQKRANEQRQGQVERAARGELEAGTTAHLSEEDRRDLARGREHSPRVAAELAAARAKLAPSRPGALKISGSMGSGRHRAAPVEAPQGREPQRLGGLLRVVRERMGPEESAA